MASPEVLAAPVPPGAVSGAPVSYNSVESVVWRGGWPALFRGESQAKVLRRAIGELNGHGRVVVAITPDRWSFWQRLGWSIVTSMTLGFVVRHENLLLVSAPAPRGADAR
ncbi:hypothetical protein K6U06_19765 [Acidiferrimicrobium sp. IK]|uniref:hypothetical protein n=1 Tax=Acidiferrimicrobium sp. IK TaxID=2871700 RepID=UPI0021CB5D17|nr:hypothetical protein [Acidiferrimicrobium sp. IK]MCU4186612.1 hypothetical protein [Acidiferrimicrobium sp. IK]